MAENEPVYKASLCKSVLDAFEKFELPPDEKAIVEKVMPSDLVDVVRSAAKTDWLPVRYGQDIWTAIHEICGADEARRFNREYTHSATNLRIFGPLLRGAMALFGGGPRGLFRVVPRSWDLVSRNAGHMTCSIPPGESTATLRYLDLAPPLRSPTFVITSGASYLGILDFLELTGTVESDDSELATGTVTHIVHWNE